MKVKIGEQTYDPGVLPIIIQLSPGDKAAISQLPEGDDVWCVHPTGYPEEELQRLMSTLPPLAHPPLAVVPDGEVTIEPPKIGISTPTQVEDAELVPDGDTTED